MEFGDSLRKKNDVALVVDGKTLTYAAGSDLKKDFLDLCLSCKVVVCCRVSPIQKAEVTPAPARRLARRRASADERKRPSPDGGDGGVGHERRDAGGGRRRQRRGHDPARVGGRGHLGRRGAAGRLRLRLLHRAGRPPCRCTLVTSVFDFVETFQFVFLLVAHPSRLRSGTAGVRFSSPANCALSEHLFSL